MSCNHYPIWSLNFPSLQATQHHCYCKEKRKKTEQKLASIEAVPLFFFIYLCDPTGNVLTATYSLFGPNSFYSNYTMSITFIFFFLVAFVIYPEDLFDILNDKLPSVVERNLLQFYFLTFHFLAIWQDIF